MNSVNLIGNLTKDIKLTQTQNGSAKATGTIAVQRLLKNESGKYESAFIMFVAYGRTAEVLDMYTKKGTKVGLEGWLDSYSFDRNDETHFVTQLVVQRVELLQQVSTTEQSKENDSDETIETSDTASQEINNDSTERADKLPF